MQSNAEQPQRLRLSPSLSVAIDLEGCLGGKLPSIDLLQLCVDAVTDTQRALIYVFDTTTTRQLLHARGPATNQGRKE